MYGCPHDKGEISTNILPLVSQMNFASAPFIVLATLVLLNSLKLKFAIIKYFIWFDINNPRKQNIGKFNIELEQPNKKDVVLNSLYGWITNIKLFDVYNDDISELLQTYPNHKHLIINDTARKIVDLDGVLLH